MESLIVKIADRLCNVHDFFIVDRDLKPSQQYSRKYYHKADVLFKAMHERKDEIIEMIASCYSQEFGELVFNRMEETRSNIEKKLSSDISMLK